ncbi:MAG: hypothetical protein ACYSR5_04305, partial [Planctomycetota bacterium]
PNCFKSIPPSRRKNEDKKMIDDPIHDKTAMTSHKKNIEQAALTSDTQSKNLKGDYGNGQIQLSRPDSRLRNRGRN